jgi:hypothetical protein
MTTKKSEQDQERRKLVMLTEEELSALTLLWTLCGKKVNIITPTSQITMDTKIATMEGNC